MQPFLCYNLSMTIFTSFGILILSVLIMCFLMLIPGIFATFFHYASGQYSRKKVDDLSLFFILGTETMTVLTFFLISIIMWVFPLPIINFSNPILLWILIGIFLALGLATFCFYFRQGSGSELFISRSLAHKFAQKAKLIKTRSDAFVFGFISGVPELPFTLPLYFISILSITNISFSPLTCSSIIVLYTLISVLPLFITHTLFRHNHNLADFIKFRTKNKLFFRFLISILYLIIAILLINFRNFIP